jgi:hypothetical protein
MFVLLSCVVSFDYAKQKHYILEDRHQTYRVTHKCRVYNTGDILFRLINCIRKVPRIFTGSTLWCRRYNIQLLVLLTIHFTFETVKIHCHIMLALVPMPSYYFECYRAQ